MSIPGVCRALLHTALVAVLPVACGTADATSPSSDALEVSGPLRFENLEVFLVHGPDRTTSDRELITLQEAMAQRKVVVHETGDVNELAIENVSDDVDVYVQAGDIVQGGKQDRAIGVDLLLAANSGRVPLAAFCVEQGRWSPRALTRASQTAEVEGRVLPMPDLSGFGASFRSSDNAVSTADLKRAVLLESDQSRVWQEVANAQAKLAVNLGQEAIVDASSPSSLELTLSSAKMEDETARFTEALGAAADDHADAIGCVFVVNGEIRNAEVYGSRALFARLWPKLLRVAAADALAERRDGETFTPIDPAAVERLIAAPAGERIAARNVHGGLEMVTNNTEGHYVVETRSDGKPWLHRTYIVK